MSRLLEAVLELLRRAQKKAVQIVFQDPFGSPHHPYARALLARTGARLSGQRCAHYTIGEAPAITPNPSLRKSKFW
jgi:hypothetical protein